MKNKAAQELGKLGGQVKSEAKTKAARANAKKPRGKRKKKTDAAGSASMEGHAARRGDHGASLVDLPERESISEGAGMIHELKIWPKHYRAVASGDKAFEVRRNDRNFQPGDTLWLREWNPDSKAFTNEPTLFRTVSMVHAELGMAPGHVVLGIKAFPAALDLEVGQ